MALTQANGIRSVDLGVPDLEGTAKFYSAVWGLKEVAREGGSLYMRATGKDRNLIEEIGLFHPMLATQMPQKDSIANAFDWEPGLRSLAQKYGDSLADMRKLYDECAPLLERQADATKMQAANS